MANKIIILGTGRSAVHSPREKKDVPKGTEVWGVTYSYRTNYVDKLFEFHGKEASQEVVPDFIERVNGLGVPVYTRFKWDELDNGIIFPIEDVVKEFNTKFFLNSISYMIAFAIMQKPKEISCLGVDMRDNIEYIKEKGCVEFWLGVAHGRGIKVSTAPCSYVLHGTQPHLTKMYEYGSYV